MKMGVLLSLLLGLIWVSIAFSAEEVATKLDSGDTAWILVSASFVMLMTVPGLALFYGGLAKQGGSLNTIFMSFVAFALVSILWVIYGYSFAFKGDLMGVIGTPTAVFMRGISIEALNNKLPELLFSFFQLTFAGITVALISGALIERMKFGAWLIFTILWFTLVYIPVAHWVWGEGFLMKLGALDFAGGTVVHINAAVAAMVGAIILGRRKETVLKPHNLPLVALGTGLLWFGWFGFNGGSALSANSLAALAMVNTNTAAATSAITWMIVEWLYGRKMTLLGFCSGAVGGLVAITPAAGFVSPISALIIGFVSGLLSFYAVAKLKPALRYDDALDVFGIHGVAGIVGCLMTGLLADPSVNPAGKGLLFGNPGQLWIQFISIVVVVIYNLIVSAVLFLGLRMVGFLRISEEEEVLGPDITLHGERAYELE